MWYEVTVIKTIPEFKHKLGSQTFSPSLGNVSCRLASKLLISLLVIFILFVPPLRCSSSLSTLPGSTKQEHPWLVHILSASSKRQNIKVKFELQNPGSWAEVQFPASYTQISNHFNFVAVWHQCDDNGRTVLTRLLLCTLRSESGSVVLGTGNYLFCCSYVYCHTLRCLPYKPAGFIKRRYQLDKIDRF